MGGEQTSRERIAILELESKFRSEQILELQNQNDRMSATLDAVLDAIKTANISHDAVIAKIDEMYPIVIDFTKVKGYGSMAWKIAKWVGGTTITILTLWKHIEHVWRWILEHLFNIKN